MSIEVGWADRIIRQNTGKRQNPNTLIFEIIFFSYFFAELILVLITIYYFLLFRLKICFIRHKIV